MYLSADLLLLHVRLLLLLLLHVGRLLLLLLHCGDLLLAAALVELVARLALLDGLGGLGADVDGADGLAVRVQRRARVLALVAGTDGVDLGEERAFIVSVPDTLTNQLHFRVHFLGSGNFFWLSFCPYHLIRYAIIQADNRQRRVT